MELWLKSFHVGCYAICISRGNLVPRLTLHPGSTPIHITHYVIIPRGGDIMQSAEHGAIYIQRRIAGPCSRGAVSVIVVMTIVPCAVCCRRESTPTECGGGVRMNIQDSRKARIGPETQSSDSLSTKRYLQGKLKPNVTQL